MALWHAVISKQEQKSIQNKPVSTRTSQLKG